MLSPDNGTYTINELFIDSVLQRQKDRLIAWLNEAESCTVPERFLVLHSKVLGSIITLADLWSVFGYSYKAQEITERIVAIREKHPLKELWK